MSIRQRGIIVLASLSGLILVCLTAPLVALAVSIRPQVYPGAVYIGMQSPTLNSTWKNECWETTLVNRWTFHSADTPTDILHWFQNEGWLVNYRYTDATRLQSTDALKLARSTTFRDTYVNKPGSMTLIIATTTYTLSLGKCVPNPAGLPIP
jgi:hypothetical protein